MIRFNCPKCERPYELPNALAHLPLVCKQCGQRITPPAPTPDPPPPPPKPVAAPKPVPPPPAPKPPAPARPVPVPPPDDTSDDDDVLVTKPDSTPDIDFNVGGPTAASLSDANRPRPTGLSDANRPRPFEYDGPTEPEINLDLLPPAPPAPPPKSRKPPAPVAPPEPPAEPTVLPFLADFVTFVLLVFVGMFLGELLAQKPTGQVLTEAGSAAKFPPIDLLLWGAPPVVLGLVYLLLGSRERSVGAWLRRRRRSA